MALWIKNRPTEKCNDGEIEVAEFLVELPDEWVIRWGFFYMDNQGVQREGDFLILSPDGGLLVLEVKSGNLEYNPQSGNWSTADGDNPQIQLDEEWKGVLNLIREFQGDRASLFVGRALALPNVNLAAGAKELHGIHRSYIFDRADLCNLSEIWDQRMEEWGARLDVRARDVFFDTFGKDVKPVAIRHFVDEIERVLIRQTEVQYELLDMLGANRQFLVQGGIGSGKTWLAFEQARRWANSGSHVLFLCYNLALTDFITKMVDRAKARKQLQKGQITVRSWEKLAGELVTRAGLPFEVPKAMPQLTTFYEQELPQLLVDIVRGNHCQPEYDCLVVDEAQDHDTTIPGFPDDWVGPGWWGVYWALLKQKSAARIAVFYDTPQRPAYRGGGFDPAALMVGTEFKPVQVKLTKPLRYTRQMLQFLAGLKSPALTALQSGLGQRGSLPEGPEVEILQAGRNETAGKVDALLTRWLKQGWCRPEQVLVLSRHSDMEKSSLNGCARLAGKPVVNHLDRVAGQIGILSAHKAKGLDVLAVVLVDYAPWETLPAGDHAGFFMGASRARQLLAVVQAV